jgi:hypothetical protein
MAQGKRATWQVRPSSRRSTAAVVRGRDCPSNHRLTAAAAAATAAATTSAAASALGLQAREPPSLVEHNHSPHHQRGTACSSAPGSRRPRSNRRWGAGCPGGRWASEQRCLSSRVIIRLFKLLRCRAGEQRQRHGGVNWDRSSGPASPHPILAHPAAPASGPRPGRKIATAASF